VTKVKKYEKKNIRKLTETCLSLMEEDELNELEFTRRKLQQGLEQGLEQGATERERTIARQMKAKGFDNATIAELTGLTDEEIDQL
jgi:predicted transposase/invertase (TIGR01784 family)